MKNVPISGTTHDPFELYGKNVFATFELMANFESAPPTTLGIDTLSNCRNNRNAARA